MNKRKLCFDCISCISCPIKLLNIKLWITPNKIMTRFSRVKVCPCNLFPCRCHSNSIFVTWKRVFPSHCVHCVCWHQWWYNIFKLWGRRHIKIMKIIVIVRWQIVRSLMTLYIIWFHKCERHWNWVWNQNNLIIRLKLISNCIHLPPAFESFGSSQYFSLKQATQQQIIATILAAIPNANQNIV